MMLSVEEANKIIADYMGVNVSNGVIWSRTTCRAQYSDSLDSLLPVWQKLNLVSVDLCFQDPDVTVYTVVELGGRESFWSYDKDLSVVERACVATAKAILNLKEDK